MPQPQITTLTSVASWCNLDQSAVESAYRAAEAYVGVRVTWAPIDDAAGFVPPAPNDLVQAVQLITARYLARKNSPDGFVGMGDLGLARVGATDRDVDRLIAPWRKQVLA